MNVRPEKCALQPLRVKVRCNLGSSQSVWLLGGIPALGSWEPARAVPLRLCPDRGQSEALIQLPGDVETFEYAFFIRDDVTGALVCRESQGTRLADLSRLASDVDGVEELYNQWEGLAVRLVIHHPTDDGRVLAVIGGHPQLGAWNAPQGMALGRQRRLLTGAVGRCWELVLAVADEGLELDYRYVMVDRHLRTAVWEREPGRRVRLPRLVDTVNGMLEVFDANFVGGMEFDPVPPAMFIGPYPQVFEDVDAMKAQGVTAVVNVQSDEDFRLRQIDWPGFQAYYRDLGIVCHRVPIRDFDEEDLVNKLSEAVGLLKRLLDQGNRVYVHCTAGMGRSPAVVIGYLSLCHEWTPEEALAHVKRHRPIVCPNMAAVRRFLDTR